MATSKKEKSIESQNLNDKYINGTAKLWKYDNEINIKDYVINKKTIGRQFIRNDSLSYLEIYEDIRLNTLGLTNQITLLSIPSDDNSPIYEEKNILGFRYYENNCNVKCNYFTLIKKNGKGFYILEKNKEIKDNKNQFFYDHNLNCYDIIQKIVYEKYKEDNMDKRTPIGELFPELMGYTYALISLGKFKNYIVLEPFIPCRLKKETLKEEIPETLEENIAYFEPIVYDNHVSVLLIVKDDKYYKSRQNYLFDMSKYHSQNIIHDFTIFPKEMTTCLKTYPWKSIQKNNSCGLWYYGILDLLKSSQKYLNVDDIMKNIKDNNIIFSVDVINFLSDKLYGIKDIFNIKKINDAKNKDDFKRIYDTIEGDNISFKQECLLNYYFSLSDKYEWVEKKKKEIYGMDLLFQYEKLLEKMRKYKKEIELNIAYFKVFSDEEDYNKNIKGCLELQLTKTKNSINDVIRNFKNEFLNLVYDNIDQYIFETEINDDNNENIDIEYFKNILQSLKKLKTKDFFELEKNFKQLKLKFKSIYLLDESFIIKYLNPNNDLAFQLMNK